MSFTDKKTLSVADAVKKIMEASAKKADKDYDKDGKIESPKDEVWGSRIRAAKMAGKLKEEEQIDEAFPTVADGEKSLKAKEGKTAHGKITKTKTGMKHERDYDDQPEPEVKRGRGRPKKRLSEMRQEYHNYFEEEVDNETFTKELEDQKAKFDGKKKGADVAKPSVQAVKQEEVEQMDELSKSTLTSYRDKANVSQGKAYDAKMAAGRKGDMDTFHKQNAIQTKRGFGLGRVMNRGVKPFGPNVKEETEQMDEVAPPGREDQVKALKKVPGITNPYAVSWASYRKSHPKKD